MRFLLFASLLWLSFGVPGLADGRSDPGKVAAVVQAFHGALARGDGQTAVDQLTEDAVILEGGRLENRSQYAAGHIQADLDYARYVTRKMGALDVRVNGDTAWVTSTSSFRGSYQGREINRRGAELLVLVHGERGWKIAAIHWSSEKAGD